MAQYGAALYRKFQVYQVFGANTNVGKTIFSTLFSRAASRNQGERSWYLKPVSTGPLDDADVRHIGRYAPGVQTQNFYQFENPVSPHLAAQVEVPNESLLEKTASQIHTNAQNGPGFMIVETAGGPHSPGPSGTSQADLYRPLRLPILLIADSHLGGISTSISAYESLKIRGYDIDGIALFKEDVYQNADYLQQYFHESKVPLLSVEQPPPAIKPSSADQAAMSTYYSSVSESPSVTSFMSTLTDRHLQRIDRIENMAASAYSRMWWPFAQHRELSPQSLNTIDSAYGDYFQTYQKPKARKQDGTESLLRPTVDGSASWWTQGLGHGNPDLMLSAAHAAGRYGHVMFASGVHEPAMELADRLISTVNNPRLNRVFFSDNGSTAMEVGLKMALKAACERYGFSPSKDQVDILGFKNSYHGDTIGSMDMSEPSVYNEKVPWYRGKGFWFDCPSVKMRQGKWVIEKPEEQRAGLGKPSTFGSLQDIYSAERDSSADAEFYKTYITSTLERLTQKEKRKFGALVLEPVILGAGGMVLADPLFQRVLVNVIRSSSHLFSASVDSKASSASVTTDPFDWAGLPIVADEVFTGLYRLGHPNACELLHFQPDISAHAKLLTGGLLPLSITAASESVYNAFLSDSKVDALLHGHSYTAHAVGCAVANTSLQQLADIDASGKWDAFKSDWSGSTSILGQLKTAFSDIAKSKPTLLKPDGTPQIELQVWSQWSQKFVEDLSNHTQRVESVWALGSVLAISLKDGSGKGGYTSNVAHGLREALYEGVDGWNIHSRVLGNVLYLMTSQVAQEQDVRRWEKRVRTALGV
ncbi:hypothetical protein FH972_023729 [Carpinus fangiana]|uniref:Dethiobiotin synthase n=1 Tax=Carpinus fangiana TaxID=176857 RepID=A0A5N6KW17_9ROSI|nr:hypothetical protein FH972_023729 [Carpinus fangiana]